MLGGKGLVTCHVLLDVHDDLALPQDPPPIGGCVELHELAGNGLSNGDH